MAGRRGQRGSETGSTSAGRCRLLASNRGWKVTVTAGPFLVELAAEVITDADEPGDSLVSLLTEVEVGATNREDVPEQIKAEEATLSGASGQTAVVIVVLTINVKKARRVPGVHKLTVEDLGLLVIGSSSLLVAVGAGGTGVASILENPGC
mgnify:CR=1 FL=1